MNKKYGIPVFIIVILLTGCQPASTVMLAKAPPVAATPPPLSSMPPAKSTSAPSPTILPETQALTTTITVTPTENQANVTPRCIGPTPTAIQVEMPARECVVDPGLRGSVFEVRFVGSTQCLLWADEYNNETGFRVVLQFGYNGDMFVYETPVNRPGMPYPGVLSTLLGQSFEYCVAHKDYTLDIYALLPGQEPKLITGFSPALGCDRFGMPSATPQPSDGSNSPILASSAEPSPTSNANRFCEDLVQHHTNTPGLKTYCDEDYGFAFDYPQDWHITLVASSPDSPASSPLWVRKAQRFEAIDMSNYIRMDTFHLYDNMTLLDRVTTFFSYSERLFADKSYPSMIGGQRAYAITNRWHQDYSAVYLFFQHGAYYSVMELKAISQSGLDTNWEIALAPSARSRRSGECHSTKPDRRLP